MSVCVSNRAELSSGVGNKELKSFAAGRVAAGAFVGGSGTGSEAGFRAGPKFHPLILMSAQLINVSW